MNGFKRDSFFFRGEGDMEIGIDQRGGRVVNFTRLSNKMLIDQSVIENLVSFQFHVRNGIRDTAACLVDGLFLML